MVSLRGLPELTWLEIKIFLREPMGAVFTILMPVIVFVGLGRVASGRTLTAPPPSLQGLFGEGGLPTLVSLMIVLSAVLSMVTIISIYREGGILKRLRATPLRPYTILSAHVVVKLVLTLLTMTLMTMAGKRYFSVGEGVPVFSFAIALLISTCSILSIGFIIASIVPTARFAQPIGAAIMYPMIAISGLFVPVALLPPWMQMIARVLPFTYVVSLLEGIWRGETWGAHMGDVAALVVVFLVCTAISSRVFRWE